MTTPNRDAQSIDQPPLPLLPRDRETNVDADLAMALRISQQEQQRIEEELKREEELLAEVLRLSLEEK